MRRFALRTLLTRLRFGFGDDREDFYSLVRDIIENPNLIDSQSILRMSHLPKTLDATFTGLGWFETQMFFDCLANGGSMKALRAFKSSTASGAKMILYGILATR